MLENLIHFLFPLTSLILFFLYRNKIKENGINYFILYLFFMFSLDFTASILSELEVKNNLYLYTILIVLQYNLLFIFYKKISSEKSTKKFINSCFIIFNLCFLITCIYNTIETSFLNSYNTISDIFGSILISIILILYLKEVLNSDKILDYKKTLSFWVTFGLLVYYLASIPFTSIINEIEGIPRQTIDLMFILIKILTIFMHSCFIFGVLWSQKGVK